MAGSSSPREAAAPAVMLVLCAEARGELPMDEYAALAKAMKLYLDQKGEPDIGFSRPVAVVRPELADIIDCMINPQAMFDWLDDDEVFARGAGNPQFKAAMDEQDLALTVGKRGDVFYINVSTNSESEQPI
jgi:hypothetical protein